MDDRGSRRRRGGRLFLRKLERRARALALHRATRLQEVTESCSNARVPADVAAVIVTQGCAALGAPRGLMYLVSDDGATLEMVEVVDYPPEVVDAVARFPMDVDGPLTEAVHTRTALFFGTAAAVLARYPHLHGLRHAEDNALAAVPLVVDGQALGVLGFVFDEGHRFDADERTFIEALARQCAHALDRTRLHQAAMAARAAAEAANRAKDEFLSTLSHELRTPLAAILGWTNMLRTRKMDTAAQARALATIERNARAQVQLIEDILDVSRIVAGKLRLERGPVDPAAVVRAAIDAVRPAADAKQISIEVWIGAQVGSLQADAGRLQQITWNLLSNAVKFTPKGGLVTVCLEPVGDRLRLDVVDAGEGITAEFLPHVFDRFRQADGSNTRAQGGLGLGLAIVKHLVELHDGTIEAASGGTGLGATFTVTLPFSAPASGDATRGSTPDGPLPNSVRLDGVRVMIVDDEADTRELTALVLRAQGANVTEAASAREAIDALAPTLPDVFVCDIGMPHEDGYSLLHKVRALTAPRWVPALALTAYAGVQDARTAELAGFQRHLAKPAAPAVLIDAVARLAGISS